MQVLDAAALQALQLHFIYCNFLSTLMVQIMNFSSHCFGLSKNLSVYIDFILKKPICEWYLDAVGRLLTKTILLSSCTMLPDPFHSV